MTRMSVKSPIASDLNAASSSCRRLVHLPDRQARKAIGRGVREVDPVDQHPDRVPLGAEVDQLAADPRALAHRQPLVADALVDRRIRAERERLRLAVDHQPSSSAPSQDTSTPCCHSNAPFLSMSRNSSSSVGQRAARRQDALLGQEGQIGRGVTDGIERLPDERRQRGRIGRWRLAAIRQSHEARAHRAKFDTPATASTPSFQFGERSRRWQTAAASGCLYSQLVDTRYGHLLAEDVLRVFGAPAAGRAVERVDRLAVVGGDDAARVA